MENFHGDAKFFSNYNKFWVLENSDHIIQSLNNINNKKRAKSIVTYYFSTLCTKLPHYHLKSKLSYIADFAFKEGDKTLIRLSNNGAAYRGRKEKGKLVLVKHHLEQL